MSTQKADKSNLQNAFELIAQAAAFVDFLPSNRARSMVGTKLDEAVLWLTQVVPDQPNQARDDDRLKDLAARELDREVAGACEELGIDYPEPTHEEIRAFRTLMERIKEQPETASLDYAQGPAVKMQSRKCALCNNTGWVLRNADGSTFPGMPFSHNYKPCPNDCDSGLGFSDPIPNYDMRIGLIILDADTEDDGA